MTRREIVELLKSLPKNIILVLDGAYAEYVIKDDYDPGFSLADEFDNVEFCGIEVLSIPLP